MPRSGRDKGQIGRAAEGKRRIVDRPAIPEREAADLLQIGEPAVCLRKHQLGIARRVLEVTVMPRVKIAIVGCVVEAQHSGKPADGVIRRARGKGGAVHALVHRRKHRHDGDPMQHHRRDQQIPMPQAEPHHEPGRCGAGEVRAELHGTPQIGSPRERAQRRGVDEAARRGRLVDGCRRRRNIGGCDGHAGFPRKRRARIFGWPSICT